MILLKVTNEKLLELAQNPTWSSLVSSLTILESANSARQYKPQNREGWIEVGEKYLPLPAIVGLAGEGVEFKPVNIYVEVANEFVDDAIPTGLPDDTRTVLIDDVETPVQNAWSDIEARVSLDGTRIIASFSENLTVEQIAILLATPNITAMNHAETLALIRTDYQVPEV